MSVQGVLFFTSKKKQNDTGSEEFERILCHLFPVYSTPQLYSYPYHVHYFLGDIINFTHLSNYNCRTFVLLAISCPIMRLLYV